MTERQANRQQKSIVVLVSGNGSNLQAIIDDIFQLKINAKISAVIANQATAYGLTRAENASIPSIYIDHKSFDSREEYDAQMVRCINEYNPDLIVTEPCVCFDRPRSW